MTKDESAVWVRRGSAVVPLKPLLHSWVEKTLAYSKCHGWEDNCWWYNERASLSVLAAAAWALPGWCALEEYATTKQGLIPESQKDSGDVRRGRCDLWIGKKTGYAIEAKQAWQSIGHRASGRNSNVWDQFRHSHKDAGSLTCDEADKRLAVVFAVPYIPASEVRARSSRKAVAIDAKKTQELSSKWIEQLALKNKVGVKGFAWVMPRKASNFVSHNGKYVFPGALMLFGERARANRRPRS